MDPVVWFDDNTGKCNLNIRGPAPLGYVEASADMPMIHQGFEPDFGVDKLEKVG